MTVAQHLRANPSFRHLGDKEVDALAFSMQERAHGDGEVVFDAGDTADAAYLVLEGQVHVVAARSETDAFGVDELVGPGDFAGLEELVRGRKHTSRCTTRGATRLARLPRDAYRLLVPGDAHISMAFQLALARELVQEARRRNQQLLAALAHAPPA